MKNRITIPANILYQNSEHNKEVNDWLKSNYLGDTSYYEILTKMNGQYFTHNTVSNKYYNGSTQSYYNRHLTLSWSSSWRSCIARKNSCSWINQDNLSEFEIIFIPHDEDHSTRLERERRHRMVLKCYLPEYGYNICKKSVGGNGTGGHRWVTNGDIDLLLKINDPTPEGFFPGQKRQSWVRNFFEKYNWEWRLRTKDSELIVLKFKDKRELLPCTYARTLKNGSRFVHSLVKNLDELYNIKITFG